MKFRASSKNIDLQVSLHPNLPKQFCTDSQRLKQIIINLISNAVKYTIEGEITLKFDLVKIKDKEDCIEISVHDTGLGIKKEDMD